MVDLKKNVYKVVDTGLRGKGLCTIKGGYLLIYRRGQYYIISQDTHEIKNKFHLPCCLLKRVLVLSRLFERLLHAEPRWAIQIDKVGVLILHEGKVFYVNIETGTWSIENISVRGKPLFISEIHDVGGFQNTYMLGDYGKNTERNEVHIYQRNEGIWKIAYTFPKEKVRHIHNIIPDKAHKCLIILTGDEDNESGIWIAEDNFKKVYPLKIGKQMYRACQAIPSDDGIIYFTDAPSEANSINYIDLKGRVSEISKLRGSCIYGVIHDNEGFFSTTCEPDAKAPNVISYWLTRKIGKGIVNYNIDIIAMKNGKNTVISKFESDRLPLRLFQYASATFTNGNDNNQYFTPVCVKKYDMHIFKIERSDQSNEFI